MPAMIPQSVLDDARTLDIIEANERGWELQVRGRDRRHLEWFIEEYMAPNSHSSIYDSKDKDYTVRFYTTRADFGDALAQASLAMDYTKFKDTANRFSWGKGKYHDLLLKIWGASLSINPAGGFYGPKSKDNPRGYEPARKARKRGNPRKWGRYDRPIGSSFLDLTEDENSDWWNNVDDEPEWAHRKSIHEMTDEELDELERAY